MKGTEIIEAIKAESVLQIASGKHYYMVEITTLDKLADLINFQGFVLEENHKHLQLLLGIKEE